VTLTDDEVTHAACIGTYRRLRALHRRRVEPYGSPVDAWEVDIEGAAAEFAVSKALGLPWRYEVVDDLSDTPVDVGDNVQVRWTKYDNGHLTIYPRDRNSDIFVLVTGRIPDFSLRGWIDGVEGKRIGRYGIDPRGNAFWIEASSLRNMNKLVEGIRA